MLETWSPTAASCWGKTSPDGGFLPVVQHLEDAAGVAGELWDQQPDHIRALLSDELGGEESAKSFVMFCAGTHDVGKVSQDFAFKAERPRSDGVDTSYLCDRMRARGFTIKHRDHPMPHGAIGQVAVLSWLQRTANPRGTMNSKAQRNARKIAMIIGGHHGVNPDATVIQRTQIAMSEEIGPWQETRDEILSTMAEATGATRHVQQWLRNGVPITVQVLVEALVIMADWIASSEFLFPYSTQVPTSQRLASAMHRLHMPDAWQPTEDLDDPEELFARRFPALSGATPNPMQVAAVEAARSMTEPGLLLLEAAMGQGKTEAALMCAEILARRFGLGGVFVGLPTMATSNPMFTRVREWLNAVPASTVGAISLAHSKAGLNEEYQSLMPWNVASADRSMPIYDDVDEDGQPTSAPPTAEAAAIVHSWFLGRKRAILADHVIGTIDQALFAGLKSKHVVLRHLGLASKVVIIDEVHAADDYMRAFLKQVLQWLGAYRVPVILMSATLPPSQRQELADAYAAGRGGTVPPLSATDDYPLLTTVTQTVSQTGAPASRPDRTVRIVPHKDDDAALAEIIAERTREGGCVGVIRDTVTRAQQTFEVLSERLDCRVVLLHSRFLAPHRAQREAELIELLGRNPEGRPERIAVVGTQVLEQSLDIDFDLLVSDVAPVDLMLQRLGRLHRHKRSRPARLQTPECLLTGVSDWTSAPPELAPTVDLIYGKAALWRCLATLAAHDYVVNLPSDIPRLVREAYSPAVTVPPGWGTALQQADDSRNLERQRQIAKPQAYLVKSPRQATGLDSGFSDVVLPDPDNPRGWATVRDSEDSIEVIVVQQGDDGTFRLLEGVGRFSGAALPLWGAPDDDLARNLAACMVSLPRVLSGPWSIDRVIAELETQPIDVSAWQISPWLRGQLVLVLDENGHSSLGGHPLSYDRHRGLIVKPVPSNRGDS